MRSKFAVLAGWLMTAGSLARRVRGARPVLLAALAFGCGAGRHSAWVAPEAEHRIHPEAEVDQPPNLVRMPVPEYPADLLRREVPGWVQLEYVVDAEGRVEAASIRVLTSSNGDLARAATAAVKQAVYEPGLMAGARVRVRMKHVVRFRVRPQ
jgi:TonB family protein